MGLIEILRKISSTKICPLESKLVSTASSSDVHLGLHLERKDFERPNIVWAHHNRFRSRRNDTADEQRTKDCGQLIIETLW
mgnify:FL=1